MCIYHIISYHIISIYFLHFFTVLTLIYKSKLFGDDTTNLELHVLMPGWSRRNLPGGDERLENFATVWEAWSSSRPWAVQIGKEQEKQKATHQIPFNIHV